MTRLSAAEFTVCWDALGLDLPPAQLTDVGPGHGFDRRTRNGAWQALTRRGLVYGGFPVPGLAGPLRLLARPEYRLDLRYGGGPHGLVVGLGAIRGTHGVAVVAAGGALTVGAQDSSRVAGTLLEVLGPVAAGVGRPVNIPADALDAALDALDTVQTGNGTAGAGLWAVADELVARGVPRLDAASLARMCEGMSARGQLGTSGFLGERRRRAPWVVGFHRGPSGWFCQVRRGGTVTVGPTDPTRCSR